MGFKINRREVQGVVILALEDRIPQDGTLQQCLDQLLEVGKIRIILDAHRVKSIGDVGLGSIAYGIAQTRKKGGGLKIVNPSKCVKDFLQLTKLDTVCEIYPTEEEALASFQKQP